MNLSGAFLRYRIMAFVTGVLLVLLVFVAIPIQIWGHNKGPESVIGTAHGFLFMVYLITALDFGLRMRWPWVKLGLVMIAGTVPFCSFIAEHIASQDYRARVSSTPAGAAVRPAR